MEVEPLQFCYVHGYVHPDGEMEAVESIPYDFVAGESDFGDPLPERCHMEEMDVIIIDPSDIHITDEETVLTQNTNGFFTLKAGDLAFILTVRGGFVPVKVLTVDDDGRTEVRVTADRIGWRKGTTETIRNPRVNLVNRNMVTYRRGQARINGALAMVSDSGKVLR